MAANVRGEETVGDLDIAVDYDSKLTGEERKEAFKKHFKASERIGRGVLDVWQWPELCKRRSSEQATRFRICENKPHHVEAPYAGCSAPKTAAKQIRQSRRGFMHLSDFISENMESIVQAWEDFARTLDPPALTMDKKALRDHASAMLRAISKDMNCRQTILEQSEKSKGHGFRDNVDTAAESHASARLLSGYTIEQIVSEFRALRASVLHLWSNSAERGQDVDAADIIRFNEAIDQALAASVNRYAGVVKKSQNLFLSLLGHDLRDPLEASITGASLIMSTTYAASRHNDLATQIFNDGQRMQKLVNNLLDFTCTQLGSALPIKATRTDIVNLCLGAVEELRRNYPGRSIKVTAKGDREGMWDAARIAQVFSNLIGNALQHGAQDEPVTVHLDCESEEIIAKIETRALL